MSHISKAVIQRSFHDHECIQQTLGSLHVNYSWQGNNYSIGCGIFIETHSQECIIKYESDNHVHLSFISDFSRIYDLKMKEKLESLQLEEARIKETAALKQFSQEEARKKELELRKERMRIEGIREKELEEKNKKVNSILERARKYGYEIREERAGTERVIQLVKRI